MSLINVIGNLTFILVAFSFLVKDIIWLRLLSISASLLSITYNLNAATTPLWVPINWNLIFLSLNFYHIFKIINGKRKILLNSIEQELYQLSFRDLNIMEFAKLIRMGKWRDADSGTVLVKEDQLMEDLYMIYNGRVEIIVNGKKINELKDGQFIGEMSFLSNKPASATVKTVLPTKYVSWKQKDLKELMTRNPALVFSLQVAMGIQMSDVLHERNKGL